MLIDVNNENIRKPIRLKVARVQAGLSCKDMAAKLGVTRQQYYGYERGKNIPSVLMAIKIATIYDIPVESLAWGDQNKL